MSEDGSSGVSVFGGWGGSKGLRFPYSNGLRFFYLGVTLHSGPLQNAMDEVYCLHLARWTNV